MVGHDRKFKDGGLTLKKQFEEVQLFSQDFSRFAVLKSLKSVKVLDFSKSYGFRNFASEFRVDRVSGVKKGKGSPHKVLETVCEELSSQDKVKNLKLHQLQQA